MLREEHHGRDSRNLWAYVDAGGDLHIDGQDLGPATSPVSGDGEHEWFTTIRAEHVPQLVALLGGDDRTAILDLLEQRFVGAGYELERIVCESRIPREFVVY